ncbi:unnamed protein product, partial [Onchocerca ochengi]|uniref:2-octaprenyl-6-methoxyphenyl hydroxylase n=1 Tax=Onchocerca ochengi TaxID=42157 RepID=A0A182F0F2_ONCOC
SGAEGANISGFAQAVLAQPLGQPASGNFYDNIVVENDGSGLIMNKALVRGSEITRIRKNFPESWIWNAAFTAE